MNRYTFLWRDETYRLDRGTLAFWPRARLVAATDGDTGLQLVTNDDSFLAYADPISCDLDRTLNVASQCTAGIEKLEKLGYTVWSIRRAIETIGASPDTPLASDLIKCLTRRFFIEKIRD